MELQICQGYRSKLINITNNKKEEYLIEILMYN